ncbi:MAG: ester cyclase [Acidimicrobiales bacterium]
MADDATTFRRIPLEIFSQGKLDLIDEIFAEDYVEHIDVPPGLPPGREGTKAFIGALRAAFPDLTMELVHQFREGDLHTGHVRTSGTMTGEFAGMPPSGKSATWEEIHIGRMADGKLVEHWGVVDRMGMLQQLGFLPTPPGS